MGLIVGCGTLPVRLDAMDRPGYSISLAGLSREDWTALRALINRSSISRGLGGYVDATAEFTCSFFTLNSTLPKPHFTSCLIRSPGIWLCVCTISFLVFREHRTPNSGSDSASDGSTQNIQKVVPLRVIRSSFILHALCSTNLPHPTDCAPNNHKVNYLVWLRQLVCGCHILTLTLLPWDLSSNCSGEWLIVLYPILAEIP